MSSSRILVVDDDPVILKVVSSNLRVRSYDVITAEDGESALIAMEQIQPNLVVLDVTMPKLDGIEVCRRIREYSSVPVLMLSARSEPQDKLMAFSVGADDYVTKPFAIDELLARISVLLNEHK